MDTRVSLLLRIRDPQDVSAWTEFDEMYRPLLYRYAKSQGLIDADAEDEVQRCMTAIQQIMSDFNYDPRKGRFKSWLRTMINNRCRNHRRDVKARMARMQAVGEMQDSGQESPEAAFERIWMEEHLRYGLSAIRAQVGESRFKAFEDYVINEHPAKKVCTTHGLTAPQLYKLKWQVTQLLREHMSNALHSRSGCLALGDLQRYHAGELNDQDSRQIEMHLECCPACGERNDHLLTKYERVCTALRCLDR